MPSEAPAGQAEPQSVPDLGRKIKRALIFAVLCGFAYAAVTEVCTQVAIRGFRGEAVFDLRPRGLAVLVDLFFKVLIVDVLFFLYTIPSFMVRRWLGCALTGLFTFLTLFMAAYLHGSFVAVADDGAAVTLGRPWPCAQVRLEYQDVAKAEADLSGRARSLWIQTSRGTDDHYGSVTVWGFDRRAREALAGLVGRLQQKCPGRVTVKETGAAFR